MRARRWGKYGGKGTHVLDLLYCEVCVCGYADCLWPDVDNDHNGAVDELLQQFVDLLVRCT